MLKLLNKKRQQYINEDNKKGIQLMDGIMNTLPKNYFKTGNSNNTASSVSKATNITKKLLKKKHWLLHGMQPQGSNITKDASKSGVLNKLKTSIKVYSRKSMALGSIGKTLLRLNSQINTFIKKKAMHNNISTTITPAISTQMREHRQEILEYFRENGVLSNEMLQFLQRDDLPKSYKSRRKRRRWLPNLRH